MFGICTNHEHEAQVNYLLTTDRKTVNYLTTICPLEPIFFQSKMSPKSVSILCILMKYDELTDELRQGYHRVIIFQSYVLKPCP